tara:strand:- start:1880 stop:2071 length:192 start_codon:yes stop_codon:yes gene_type:complete
MTGDTKYVGSMSNDVMSINSSLVGDFKFRTVFLSTQALDFLMTEDDDFIVVSDSGEMTNDNKL